MVHFWLLKNMCNLGTFQSKNWQKWTKFVHLSTSFLKMNLLELLVHFFYMLAVESWVSLCNLIEIDMMPYNENNWMFLQKPCCCSSCASKISSSATFLISCLWLSWLFWPSILQSSYKFSTRCVLHMHFVLVFTCSAWDTTIQHIISIFFFSKANDHGRGVLFLGCTQSVLVWHLVCLLNNNFH